MLFFFKVSRIFFTHDESESVATHESSVIQSLDDRGVRIFQLRVLPHKSNPYLLLVLLVAIISVRGGVYW